MNIFGVENNKYVKYIYTGVGDKALQGMVNILGSRVRAMPTTRGDWTVIVLKK